MSDSGLSPARLAADLAALAEQGTAPERYIVAFSGGLDSSVLLHALASGAAGSTPVHAVYVDHQLQANSAAWSRHCAAFATSLGVSFETETVTVATDDAQGIEAAARAARYAALLNHVRSNDWLLSAHHQDDQAETLLLNLLRGSGPAGVAAMRMRRSFGDGWLVRPMLHVPREELERYANDAKLTWIDDPSNEERAFDRNFLRKEVLPLLRQRWPGSAGRLARSASLARDSANLLADLADADLATPQLAARIAPGQVRLSLAGLRALSASRLGNLLRRAVELAALPPLPAARLTSIVEALLPAREDGQPKVSWHGASARRYRDTVYIDSDMASAGFNGLTLQPGPGVALGGGLGTLRLVDSAGRGLPPALVEAGLCLRCRAGGEEIKPLGQTHTKKLKKLLQEQAVLPWKREQLPLVYAGERLVAVADLWLADDCVVADGYALEWLDRPMSLFAQGLSDNV